MNEQKIIKREKGNKMRKIIFLHEARDYYTCPGCGANLDHGEKCDDPKCPESPYYKKEEPEEKQKN